MRRDLLRARQRCLEDLVADWKPQDPQLDAAIVRLSEELSNSEQGV
jgi:hypothetical protein